MYSFSEYDCCPMCGYEKEKIKKTIKNVNGDLIEIDELSDDEIKEIRKKVIIGEYHKLRKFSEYKSIVDKRYNSNWVWARITDKFSLDELISVSDTINIPKHFLEKKVLSESIQKSSRAS
jgi:copper chaperone CopZ